MLLDRTSFKQFAGLKSLDQVSDQKTLWKYRDQLSKSGCMDELFGVFKDQLCARDFELTSGQIVDSSIVSVAVQRNSREENPSSKAKRFWRTGKRSRTSYVKKMFKHDGQRKG